MWGGRILCILTLTYFVITPQLAQANEWERITTGSNEPLILPVTFPTEVGVTYAYKLCTSHIARLAPTTSATNLSCGGETWYEHTWHTTSDAWRDMPKFTADTTQTTRTLIGKTTLSPEYTTYAYVVVTKMHDTTPTGATFLATNRYELSPITGTIPVTLRAYDVGGSPLTEGVIYIQDGDTARTLPLIDTHTVTTRVTHTTISLRVTTASGSAVGQLTTRTLKGTGSFTIDINRPKLPPQHPKLTLSAAEVLTNEEITATLFTTHSVPVSWFVNGEQLTSDSTSIRFRPPRRGTYMITAQLPDTGETATASFQAYTDDTVQLLSLIPKTEANTEEVTLRNAGTRSVHLQGWRLQSRETTTALLLTGIIAPQSDLIITSSGKLRDSGGTYDLRNELGIVVDSVTYNRVDAGDTLTRENNVWSQPSRTTSQKTDSKQTAATSATFSAAEVTGVVTQPNGRTIDITTHDGTAVRIVLHASYTTPKPRIFTGSTVTATGTWRTSRRGPYVSVRSGDFFAVVALPSTQTKKTRAAAKQVSRPSAPPLPPRPQTPPSLQRIAETVPIWHKRYSRPIAHYPRLGLSGLFTMGTLLILPFERRKRV